MDVRELYDINLMYQHYKRGEPIDKQRLIEILRKTESLDDYLFSIDELTSFWADCLDDNVGYKLKHNEKEISHVMIKSTLPWMIADNEHTNVKQPKTTAYKELAKQHNCAPKHVKGLIRKIWSMEELDLEVERQREYIRAEEGS